MENEIKIWLLDIKQAIQEIFDFLPDKRNFYKFQDDLKTRKAVERNIEIIGEVMDRILKKQPNFKISNARRIVDTRNRVIHGYDSVSEDIIWAIVIKELPKLEAEVNELLNE